MIDNIIYTLSSLTMSFFFRSFVLLPCLLRQIALEEIDLAVEGTHPVLRLRHQDLGQVLDQIMADQHTAMPDLVLAKAGLVLAKPGRVSVTRRGSIMTKGLVKV